MEKGRMEEDFIIIFFEENAGRKKEELVQFQIDAFRVGLRRW